MPDPKVIAQTCAKLIVPKPSPSSSSRWFGRLVQLNWAWAAAAIGVLLCIALQSKVYPNHDVGWVLYSSGRMLEGQVFSRDIIAANPPLIWYLNLPPAWLAKVTGIQDATVFRLYVIGLAVLCLALSWRALQGTGCGRDPILSRTFIAVAAAYWLVLPGREFGQREHLMLMLATPCVLLAAARLSNDRLSPGLRLACGLMAGIGFSLKPYFLAVPLLIETHQLLAMRPFRWKPRLELVAMMATGSLYLLSIPIFAPDYFSHVVPMVRTIYWGFESSSVTVLAQIAPELALLPFLLALLLYNRGRPRDVQSVLGIAAAGLFFAYVAQMKGYAYHAYPFKGIMLLWVLVNTVELVRSPHLSRRKVSSWVWVALALAGLSLPLWTGSSRLLNWYRDANVDSGVLGRQTAELIDLVNRYAGEEYFTAFSTHPYPGFPISNYSQAKWGARTNSHFMIPAVAKLRETGAKHGFNSQEEIERMARQFVLDDLIRFEPALVLVDQRSRRYALQDSAFDILGFYLEDPRFREIWARYTEISSMHGFRVFIRTSRRNDQGHPSQ